MANNTPYIIGAVIIILIIIGAAVFLYAPSKPAATLPVSQQSSSNQSTQTQYQNGTVNVPMQLTDPPEVPSGTQSLVIAYSSEQVHLSNAGNQSGWISAKENGSIDLLSIVNLSQTISTISIPAGARINMARFNITSASIVINGTTYNVTVPSGEVTAHINDEQVNSSSGILLDLSPTVAEIVTDNSTIFVMVPSLRAIIVANASASANAHVGEKAKLTAKEHAELKYAASNITIANASISVGADNVTYISVTVKDNSNSSVILRHLSVFGNISVRFNSSRVEDKINNFVNVSVKRLSNMCTEYYNHLNQTGANANASSSVSTEGNDSGISGSANLSISGYGSIGNSREKSSSNTSGKFNETEFKDYFHLNNSIDVTGGFAGGVQLAFNGSVCSGDWANSSRQEINGAEMKASAALLRRESEHKMSLLFAIGSNDSLSLPMAEGEVESNGIVLNANQSVTLHFTGVLGSHSDNSILHGTLASGDVYKLVIQGEDGARAQTNVTAVSG